LTVVLHCSSNALATERCAVAKMTSRAKRPATTGGVRKGPKLFRRTSSGGVVKAANRIVKPRQDDVVRARINADTKM